MIRISRNNVNSETSYITREETRQLIVEGKSKCVNEVNFDVFITCRYITLASRAFLDNQYAFIAATAFVLWRIMANALEGVEKGMQINKLHKLIGSLSPFHFTKLLLNVYISDCISGSQED